METEEQLVKRFKAWREKCRLNAELWFARVNLADMVLDFAGKIELSSEESREVMMKRINDKRTEIRKLYAEAQTHEGDK